MCKCVSVWAEGRWGETAFQIPVSSDEWHLLPISVSWRVESVPSKRVGMVNIQEKQRQRVKMLRPFVFYLLGYL